ncbi:MAG: class I SAM-dependent methyltransferase [Armatimonadetes bacterium]|nr:class I SAM-dependent methyltransferase [Armatimonadota bacterium]
MDRDHSGDQRTLTGGLGIHPALLTFLQVTQAPMPPAAVLELGCGNGQTACVLAAKGYQVTAIDLDPGAIGQARALASQCGVSVDFRVTEVTGIEQYTPASFSLVVAVDFLHMVSAERRELLLNAVRRLLVPGGTFLVIDRSSITKLLPHHEGFHVLEGSGYIAFQKVTVSGPGVGVSRG